MRKNLWNYERKKYFGKRGISLAWFDVPPAVNAPEHETTREEREKGL